MKLLITGSDKIYAIENFYANYLKELGVDVYHFCTQSLFYDYYHQSILNKLVFRAGLSGIYKTINEEFKQLVEKFEPDIVWVFKGMEILPESLQFAKRQKIKLVNYNPDSPFIFSARGSGNANVKKSISLYDLHLTYHPGVKKRIDSHYKTSSAILPFGFDLNDALYDKCCRQQEVVKACFVGNPDKQRINFLLQLANGGVKLDVFGNFWKRYISHPNISVFSPVLGDDFWLTLRKYRIQLNLMRPHNPDSHNMRSFEIPGVGGVQLAPDTCDHKTYFLPGKEIFLYKDASDCIEQINRLLTLTAGVVNEIRLNARKRSIQSAYTYKDRACQALVHLKRLSA